MGIVPWVSKSEKLRPMPLQDPSPGSEPTLNLTPAPEQIQRPGLMPQAVGELKQWLPSQAVGLLSVRSMPLSFVGQAEAPLLVVVESTKSADLPQSPPTSPFKAESAQLFDLMMRSINITLGQRKLCYLSSETELMGAENSDNVMDLCVPQTRAVLLLVQDWNSLTVPVVDHFRMDQPPLPVWRIPHPDLLLEFNQLKRQAWVSLQALQSVLS